LKGEDAAAGTAAEVLLLRIRIALPPTSYGIGWSDKEVEDKLESTSQY
jgi:hypothetical protein